MSNNYSLPPDPQKAVLTRIYPWDKYNKDLVMQWLYAQAKETGFVGAFEDFKLRFGIYVEGLDEEGLHYTLENYEGMYNVIPLLEIEQVLHTKNKILNKDIIVAPVPQEYINKRPKYIGKTEVIPTPYFGVTLRTKDTIVENDIIVQPIPYKEENNEFGGVTVTIG